MEDLKKEEKKNLEDEALEEKDLDQVAGGYPETPPPYGKSN